MLLRRSARAARPIAGPTAPRARTSCKSLANLFTRSAAAASTGGGVRRRGSARVGGNAALAAAAAASSPPPPARRQQKQNYQQQLDRRRTASCVVVRSAGSQGAVAASGSDGEQRDREEDDDDLLAAFSSLPPAADGAATATAAATAAATATTSSPPTADNATLPTSTSSSSFSSSSAPLFGLLWVPLLTTLLAQPLSAALAAARRTWAAASQRLRRSVVGLYWPIIARVLVTLAMLAVIRAGHYVPLPGVDLAAAAVGNAAVGAAAEGGALAAGGEGERMLRALYGQAGELPASLFDLGIGPHINASIVLMVVLLLPKDLLPYAWAQRLRDARKEGKGGEALLNERTNWLALAFACYGALVRVRELAPYAIGVAATDAAAAAAAAAASSSWQPWLAALALIGGAQATHHCASAVTASGVGNGSTLVICAGIATEYARTLAQALALLDAGTLQGVQLVGVAAGYLSLALFAVFVASTELRLPVVQYASTPPPQLSGSGGGGGGGAGGMELGGRAAMYAAARALLDRRAADAASAGGGVGSGGSGGSRGAALPAPAPSSHPSSSSSSSSPSSTSHFPILLNSSGVMPMIVASAAYYGLLPRALDFCGLLSAAAALSSFQGTAGGLLVYGLLVFAMEFLPFGAVNPAEVSEYFSTINVGIRGVAPGPPTVEHLKRKVRQCKLWGGLALAALAVSAHLFDAAVAAATGGTSLATTSLVIIVGAVLQTSRQVEALLDGPRLQRRLDAEREAIAGLAF
jgi:preprotein translocase subunit SecY